MRWTPGGGGDVEDRRGGGGLGGLPIPLGRGGGIGSLVLVLLLAVFGGSRVLGGGGGGFDPGGLNGLPGGTAADSRGLQGAPDSDRQLAQFVSFVVTDAQDFWTERFRVAGQQYQRSRLVLYTGATSTGCGVGQASAGPFYCPADTRIYLDLGFFTELARRFRAAGDFAQAYVIAHEVAHHVQNLLGVSDRVHARQRQEPGDANELSVRLELQADCLAGVWAHSTYQRGLLEAGDVEEALTAAAAVGDDRIQRQAGGQVRPEAFTHGTSEQRQTWFDRGYERGEPDTCNTFDADI